MGNSAIRIGGQHQYQCTDCTLNWGRSGSETETLPCQPYALGPTPIWSEEIWVIDLIRPRHFLLFSGCQDQCSGRNGITLADRTERTATTRQEERRERKSRQYRRRRSRGTTRPSELAELSGAGSGIKQFRDFRDGEEPREEDALHGVKKKRKASG